MRQGNSILGTPESITAAWARDQMHEYFERRYVPTNITVAVAGNFDWPAVISLVESQCGGWAKGAAGRIGVTETPGSGTFNVMQREKVTQEHVYLISSAPAADSPLRHAADTLALAIGDDSGSRLYWSLVDPGLAESADCSFHDYEGAGSFYTSLSCEPARTEENLKLVREVLDDVQKNGITEEDLKSSQESKIGSARGKLLRRTAHGPHAIARDVVDLPEALPQRRRRIEGFQRRHAGFDPRSARPLPVGPGNDAGARAVGQAEWGEVSNNSEPLFAYLSVQQRQCFLPRMGQDIKAQGRVLAHPGLVN